MNDFILDVESLSVFDSCVILSIGCISVDFEKDFTFQQLVREGFFVKLDAKSQIETGRHVMKSTLEFWQKVSKEDGPAAAAVSFTVNPAQDIPLVDGLEKLRVYLKEQKFDRYNSTIWTRGALDHSCLQHAWITNGVDQLFPYGRVRDIRTAIDFLHGSSNGYAEFEGGCPGLIEHHPVHDCARDAMMMKYGTGPQARRF